MRIAEINRAYAAYGRTGNLLGLDDSLKADTRENHELCARVEAIDIVGRIGLGEACALCSG